MRARQPQSSDFVPYEPIFDNEGFESTEVPEAKEEDCDDCGEEKKEDCLDCEDKE